MVATLQNFKNQKQPVESSLLLTSHFFFFSFISSAGVPELDSMLWRLRN